MTPSPQKPNTCKGGRPQGSTISKRKNLEKAIISTLNEIAEIYDREKKGKNKKLIRGRLQKIIKQVREYNNIPADVVIKV